MPTAHDTPDSAEISVPQDDLATRKTLAEFELKKKLGQGGMGAVYLAVDPKLKRQVALKILPREKASNPQLVKRFKAEAQNASQLTHENIVAVYGAGEADGYLYIALEYVDGIDVHDLVERRGVLPVKRSIDIIKQVARALQHALDQGIVHRDIKPANLLVRRDGVVKLADMGLARAVDESIETSLTRAGTTVGTVDYMSPEQARNSKAADVRSDIYSLGCTWYHMLTGSPPFSDGSLTNKLHAHAKQEIPDPRDKNPSVPEGVVAVIQRMMAKDPNARYQTPAELIRDLEGALVNKDAVSRKILEAIDDDSFHGQVPTFDDEPGGGANPSPPRVNLAFSDSVEAVSAPADTAAGAAARTAIAPDVDDEEFDAYATVPPTPSGSTPPKPKRPAPTKGSASTSTSNRHTSGGESRSAPEPESEPDVPTTSRKSPNTSKSGNPPAKPGMSFSKPSFGFGKSSSEGGKKATARTLPPPGRKAPPDGEQRAGAGPQLKTLLTVLGVLVAFGAVIFLANLAQQLGGAAAPANVVNPFENQLPPAPGPVQPQRPGAAAEDKEKADKDVLVEKEANGNASGTPVASASATGLGPADLLNNAVDLNSQDKTVPAWVRDEQLANKVPQFGVRKGTTVEAERHYGSLSEAFQKLGPDGARIVLFHDGPFDLTPLDIKSGVLTLEAAQGTRPQIRLVADGDHKKLPWLNVTGGTLVLDGVDIVGDAATVPAADPWTWVRVTNGHLIIRRSSFTLTGKRTGSTTAVKLAGVLADKSQPAVKQSRFLLDAVVIRGDGLQCVQLESPSFEGVIRNSLLVAGEATAVSLPSVESKDPKHNRQLRFVTTTVCSNHRALQLSSKGPNPIQTDLISLGSLFAASSEARNAVWIYLEDWPRNKLGMPPDQPYKNFTWTAGGSAVLGFNPLLTSRTDESATIADEATWKKTFKSETLTTFSKLNWPHAVKEGISKAPLKSWSLKSLESLPLVFPVAGTTPGAPVSGLRAADFSVDAKTVVARAQRPVPPPRMVAKTPVQVDLLRTDLGKHIASQDWEDGTVFVASGHGTRYSSPIIVDKHRWIIQFRQLDGPPLIITPRGAAPRSGGDNGAFITVRSGQIEIERGAFVFDAKDSPSISPWFIHAEGGGFVLQDCRIAMPAVSTNRNQGLIRWAAGTTAGATTEGEVSSYGQIFNSLLVGNGMLISADMHRRALILKNCALIGRQHVFELQAGAAKGSDVGIVDAQNCTYLAAGTQFSIKSQVGSTGTPLPLKIFHYDCAFGTLPRDESTSKAAPLFMNYLGGPDVTKQVEWYEESCGYVTDLRTLFATNATLPNVPLPAQEFSTWTKRWGTDRVQRPLSGAGGVMFEKSLTSTFALVKPENLRMHKTSKAFGWSERGGPIGAHPTFLEPPPPPRGAPPPINKRPPPKNQPKVKF